MTYPARVSLWTGFGMVMLVAGYCGVWRPATMMHQVGIDGLLPEAGRRCERAKRFVVICSSVRPPGVRQWEVPAERIVLNSVTRANLGAIRTWDEPDSVAWERARDSIRKAMQARSAVSLDCGYPRRAGHGAVEDWKLPQQDIRVMAFRSGGRGLFAPAWAIQVAGRSGRPHCFDGTITVRLLTPREILALIQKRIAAVVLGID